LARDKAMRDGGAGLGGLLGFGMTALLVPVTNVVAGQACPLWGRLSESNLRRSRGDIDAWRQAPMGSA